MSTGSSFESKWINSDTFLRKKDFTSRWCSPDGHALNRMVSGHVRAWLAGFTNPMDPADGKGTVAEEHPAGAEKTRT